MLRVAAPSESRALPGASPPPTPPRAHDRPRRRRRAAATLPAPLRAPHSVRTTLAALASPTSRNMSDDHGATRKTDRTSQELDSVRAMVAEMRRDIAALRAELGPDAAPLHVAPWPTAASAYASLPTVPRV